MNNEKIIEKVLKEQCIPEGYKGSYEKYIVEKALAEKDKIERNYKTNYWELYYPDGTSSISNFNPLKNKEEEFSKKIDEAKFLTKMQKFMINDKILGMKNSHNLKDEVS